MKRVNKDKEIKFINSLQAFGKFRQQYHFAYIAGIRSLTGRVSIRLIGRVDYSDRLQADFFHSLPSKFSRGSSAKKQNLENPAALLVPVFPGSRSPSRQPGV
jgi:hypothetical protein